MAAEDVPAVDATVLLSTSTSLSSLPLVVFVGLFGAVVTFIYRGAIVAWLLLPVVTAIALAVD